MVEYVILMKVMDPTNIDQALAGISGLLEVYELVDPSLSAIVGEYDLMLTAGFPNEYEEVAFAADAHSTCGVSTTSMRTYSLATEWPREVTTRRKG
jgi:hypothetical protein